MSRCFVGFMADEGQVGVSDSPRVDVHVTIFISPETLQSLLRRTLLMLLVGVLESVERSNLRYRAVADDAVFIAASAVESRVNFSGIVWGVVGPPMGRKSAKVGVDC
jgi:hypothetical protein